MKRTGLFALLALILLVVLGVGVAALAQPQPAEDTSPSGYWVATHYFSAHEGAFGQGLNLLVTTPDPRAAAELVTRIRGGSQAVVVVQAPAELGELRLGLRPVAGVQSARAFWPDPATAGVRQVRLGSTAFALSSLDGPPILRTPAGGAVLTRLSLGRGTLWLVTDPGFFNNTEMAWPGHLGVLANLVQENGGAVNFAHWPQPPWQLELPSPGRVNAALLALLPGLILLLWALGARFGAVRRIRRPDRLASDDREALSWLMRRRQAGRLVLRALLDEHRDTLPAALQRDISYRIAQGPVSSRELRMWRQRITENGGTRVG